MAQVAFAAAATDAELAQSIGAGGPARAAEAEFCRRFAPRIRSFGLRHLRDEHAADDLVQRVLALTLEKLRAGAVREPGRIASFVLGSARLTAQSMKRDGRRFDSLTNDHPALDDHVVEPREPLDRARVLNCLDELSERERTVIVLTFFDGESTDDIGRTLGIDSGHVRVVRHRALNRLRACLESQKEQGDARTM